MRSVEMTGGFSVHEGIQISVGGPRRKMEGSENTEENPVVSRGM